MRFDWDLLPGMYSLSFMTKVNLGMSMSLQRALRKGGEGEAMKNERSIGAVAARVLHSLIHGEYEDSNGRMVPVKGDIYKLNG